MSNFGLHGVEHKILEKSRHFASGDNSVAIDVELLEESVELRDGWRGLAVILEEVLEEVHGLHSVQVVAAVNIVVVPHLVNLLSDVLVVRQVGKRYWKVSLRIQERLYEPGHFLLLDQPVSVLVELQEEPLECLHVWSWLSLGLKKVPEEVGGLNFVQSAASVDVMLYPNLVHLVSDVVLLVEVAPSVHHWLRFNCNRQVSLGRVVAWRRQSWSVVRKQFLMLLGVVQHHVIQSLLIIVER